MTTIPDHVGREAVRLMNETYGYAIYRWPLNRENTHVITVAKLLMNPPAPMTDPDEEAAKRVLRAFFDKPDNQARTRATEQMRKERELWEAGR